MSTATREKPILFNSSMVRAILDGRKVQTRRIVKPQPSHTTAKGQQYDKDDPTWIWVNGYDGSIDGKIGDGNCPFGSVGDRLWVRETWRPVYVQGGTGLFPGTTSEHIEYRASEGKLLKCKCTRSQSGNYYDGASSKPFTNAGYWSTSSGGSGNWRPSIHMPRWASRITLEITDVRVERLQEISEEDAQAEGVRWPNPDTDVVLGKVHPTCIDTFHELWDSINKPPHDWNSNPWVWVVAFKPQKQTN